MRYDLPPTARQPSPSPPPAQYPRAGYEQPPAAQAPPRQPPRPPRPQAQQATSPLGIDPETWAAIRQSAARLSRDEGTFVRDLHYYVTRLIRKPAEAPAPDMWVFCQRMVQSLLWVALTDQPLGVVADVLREVGAQNWLEGFPDALYEDVAHALVQTVHYLSGHDQAASAGSAWVSYFLWVKPHLEAGAQQAVASYLAAQQEAERQAAEQRAAAEREAARAKALSRDPRGGQVAGDVNLESGAGLRDEDEDEDERVPYGQIMVSMTRNQPRDPSRRRRS